MYIDVAPRYGYKAAAPRERAHCGHTFGASSTHMPAGSHAGQVLAHTKIHSHHVSMYIKNPNSEPVTRGGNSTNRIDEGGHGASAVTTSASSEGCDGLNRGAAVKASVATSRFCVRMKAPLKSIQLPSTQHTTNTTIGGLLWVGRPATGRPASSGAAAAI